MIRNIALLTLGLLVSPLAMSSAIIETWTVNNYATFVNWTDGSPGVNVGETTGHSPNPVLESDFSPTADELRWGQSVNVGQGSGQTGGIDNQSGLFITSAAPIGACGPRACGAIEGLAVQTNGPAVDTLTYNHDNNVIRGGTGVLNTSDVVGKITLSAPELGPIVIEDVATYTLKFFETTNTSGSAGCDQAVQPIDTPCPDVFGIASNDLIIDFESGVGSFVRTLDLTPLGYGVYNIFATLEGLVPVDPARCPAGFVACAGLVTQENTLNSFGATIRIVSVPEPAIHLLLGVGLLALVRSRRKLARRK